MKYIVLYIISNVNNFLNRKLYIETYAGEIFQGGQNL
jgi:hypothetical protein